MNRVALKLLHDIRKNVTKNVYRSQSGNSQDKLFEKDEKPTERNENKKCEEMNISTKTKQKLPPREPLLKNFLIGKVDKELVPFPEVISRDDIIKLSSDLCKIREYFSNELDVKQIYATDSINLGIKNKLQDLNIFGNNIPQYLGGSGFFVTENFVAAESTSVSTEISQILSNHSLLVDILLKFGSDSQKNEIIPQLASGNVMATTALCELSPLENKFFNTTAEYDDLEKTWVINGEKSFVVNGKGAHLILILAETNKLNQAGDFTRGISAFLIDANHTGVKRENQFTLGCKASEYSMITFKNVTIPECSIVGEINKGNDIAEHLFNWQRLYISLINLGVTKSLIKILTEYSISEKQGPIFFKDMEIVGRRLSELTCKAYALESMIYFTAGLIDEFDNQDINMEAAATKLYSLETLWAAASSPMEFIGSRTLLCGSSTEAILRNAAQMCTESESKSSLHLYIGLLGLQHAGVHTHQTIHKDRNPLFYPGYMISKIIKQENLENPKPKWQLHEELHPTLLIPVKLMEQSISRMQMSVEMLLTRYGTGVLDKHTDIKRIAEMAALNFSMFTCLSRASRSYCIGLNLADSEMLLATTICYHATEHIKTLASEISLGPYINCDKNHMKIAKQVYKSRGYFFEHPTTYNF